MTWSTRAISARPYPQTRAQAYQDDKITAFKVADSAVLSALPPAVARFAVGSGIAWQRVALAVVRDGAVRRPSI
jgi:hypothetical protein